MEEEEVELFQFHGNFNMQTKAWKIREYEKYWNDFVSWK